MYIVTVNENVLLTPVSITCLWTRSNITLVAPTHTHTHTHTRARARTHSTRLSLAKHKLSPVGMPALAYINNAWSVRTQRVSVRTQRV